MPEVDIETNGKPSENAEATAASIVITPVEGTEKVAAAEPEKANTSKPMSYSAKLCQTVTLSAVVLAVLYAAGVFDRFSALFNYMVAERPVLTVIVSLVLSVLLSLALSALLPSKLESLSNAPFLGMLYFWAGTLWYNTLDGHLLNLSLAMTPSGLASLLLAVAAFTFCLYYHDESKVSGRVVGFFYMNLVFNVLAFAAVALVSFFVSDIKEEASQAVASQIEVPVRVAEIIGAACPLAYSTDYCNLVKQLVESPETKVKTR
jgi:hypothetical protein